MIKLKRSDESKGVDAEKQRIGLSLLINEERDRRMAQGVYYKGKLIQTRPSDVSNLLTMASFVDENEVHQWITADNTTLDLTQDDMIALLKLVQKWLRQHHLFARIAKDTGTEDYTNDKYWPNQETFS